MECPFGQSYWLAICFFQKENRIRKEKYLD